jgi:ABC-type multidrug transport system fused ATPase/permease subunit
VYGAGTMFSRRAHRASKARSDAQARANQIAASLFPLGELFSVVTISAVVVVGVTAGPGRGLTAGALIGFVFLAYRFLEPIAEFTEILDQTQTAVAGLRRVLGVLDMPVGPPQPSQAIALPDGRLDIDVVDVTFAYTNRSLSSGLDAPVLHRIDAHIPAGQQIALIGETGSGKTTLGRLIARLADPVGGEIRLGDIPLTQVDNSELRRRLVVVAQEPFLFDDTIAANVRFASPDADDASIDRIVEQLDIADWVRSLPNGLDTMVGERGAGLSAGERQLVALMRAGVADPDVLVLDEATSSVDALTEVRISRALGRLSAGRTTIAIAHRLSTAARADRVLVLDGGRLIEDGHHDELVAAGGHYARLYEGWLSSTSADS